MKNPRRVLFLLALPLFALVPACHAQVGSKRAPSDTGAQCGEQCAAIGMRLSQVALMAGEVGCICDVAVQTRPAPAGVPPQGAGAPAVIMMHDRSQSEKYERSAR